MSNSRAIVTAVLLALSTASTSALSAAQNEVAVASADGDVQNQRSVEDLVAIAKAGESNEAINDEANHCGIIQASVKPSVALPVRPSA